MASDETVRGYGEDPALAATAAGTEPNATPAAVGRPALDRGAADATYELADELGRGGMGRVVAAYDKKLGRRVALKLLQTAEGPLAERFAREAQLTAQLQHPSIVPVYDAGTLDGREPFYAMKLVSGVAFDRRIAGAAALRDRLALVPNVLAVADALAYAHDRGIIHRDLKPQNVILGEFGETIVLDWGLAKALETAETPPPATPAGSPDLTLAGSVMGTPAYMAPEQARGEAADARADVYALGAMLYHVLAGVVPHPGRTAQEMLAAARTGAVIPLRDRAEVPVEVAAIVDKAMALAPTARYPDARAFADDLRRFLTGQLVAAHRYTRLDRARLWIRRHRAASTVGAVALVILLAFGAWSIRRIVAESARADRERDQAIELARANERLANERQAALEREQAVRRQAEQQRELARRFIVNQLQPHLELSRLAGELAVSRDATANRALVTTAVERARALGPDAAAATAALAIVAVAPRGDDRLREQRALAVVKAARAGWEALTVAAIARSADLEPLVIGVEREQIVRPLLARATAAAAGLGGPEHARAARDFWQLYWGELHFIETPRLGGNAVEQAMVKLGHAIGGTELDRAGLAEARAELDAAARTMLATP